MTQILRTAADGIKAPVTAEPGSPDLEAARVALIDCFVECDDFLARCAQTPDLPASIDVSIAERLAIRLLVKRFGWRMTGPGQLLRLRTACEQAAQGPDAREAA